MLVHICCSVDSHFFLQKLQKLYPDEELIGFFYDPNIHPYSEYLLRLLDVQRSCKMLGIKLIEGEYDVNGWLEAVRGYENEPEKGKRCTLCFDNRVEASMKKAKEIGCDKVTTTLLTSPKKSIEQLSEVGDELAKKYKVEFVSVDFRKNGGTNEQFLLAKRDKLYHQDYCGCIYALNKQRDTQKKIADELFSNVGKQIQPESIEERIELYKKRVKLEEKNVCYEIVKESFINYRVLRAYLSVDKKVIPSYPLFYSYLKKRKTKLRVEKSIKGIYYANRDNVKFIELSYFNKILNLSYKSVKEVIYQPPLVKDEIKLRNQIESSFYSLSPIILVDKVDFKRFELYLDAIYYDDIRENLVIL